MANFKDKGKRLLNQVESMSFYWEVVKSTGHCFPLFKTRWKCDAMQMGRYDKCKNLSMDSGRKPWNTKSARQALDCGN